MHVENGSENQDKLSVILVTLNEEANIERCLRSLRGVDEIVIYDSGSKDQTLNLARAVVRLELPNTSLRVEQGAWMGFGPTKHLATGFAKNDWVISLDADEVVSPELFHEIKEQLPKLDPQVGYRIPRRSRYLGTWIAYGGWYPDLQLRLFNRKFSHWDAEPIHEKVIAPKLGKLSGDLLHYVFRDIEHQVQTNNRYSTLQAKKLLIQEVEFSWFHFMTKPTVKFLECYILKLGFLDGWPGYVIARNASHSVFMKWAKLRELELNRAHEMETTVSRINEESRVK